MKLTTIRLDILDDNVDAERLTTFLRAAGQPYVVYREIADVTGKAHFQGYMVRDEETYNQLKKDWVKEFSKTHTRYQRSFTPVRKVEEYMKYVAKDKELFLVHGFTEQHIKEKEDASYQKGTKGTKKSTRIGEQICGDAREQWKERKPQNIEEVARWVTEWFGGQEKCFDMPYVEKYTHLILYTICGDKYVRKFSRRVAERIQVFCNLESSLSEWD